MFIEQQSSVDAPAEQVWARVVTPEGINDEVRPWMSMHRWRHERSVEPGDDGKTIVRDRITFTLRAPLRPLASQ